MAHTSVSTSISLCMIVKNEAQFLARCLESARAVSSEIIVCDTGSQDRTKEIAQEFGAKVFNLPWNDSFAEARNFSLAQAQRDWILVLDADEAIDPTQHEKLLELTQQRRCYSLLRRHYFAEPQANLIAFRREEYSWPETPLGYITTHDIRLFPNDASIRFRGEIHESVEPSIAEGNKFKIELCEVRIHHFGHLKPEAARKTKNENYIQLCLRKVQSGSNDWKSWFELGVELQQLGRQDEGIECLKQAISLCPDYHASWLQLGLGFLETGRPQNAIECLGKALNIAPSCVMTWNAMGVALLRLARVDEAILCFKTTLESQPDNLGAKANLEQALQMKDMGSTLN